MVRAVVLFIRLSHGNSTTNVATRSFHGMARDTREILLIVFVIRLALYYILVMVRAFALFFFYQESGGPSNDALLVTDGRITDTRIGTRSRLRIAHLLARG